MHKKRERKSKRNHRNKRGWGCLLLLFLALVVAIVLLSYSKDRYELAMARTAELFLERVTAGDRAGSALLYNGDQRDLDELISITAEQNLEWGRVERASLTSLNSGLVNVGLQLESRTFPLSFGLERREKRWIVTSFPFINRYAAALYTGGKPGRISLFCEGEELDLRLPLPLDLEPESVVSVTVIGDLAVAVDELETVLLSRLLRYTPGMLEGEQEGEIPLHGPLPVFHVQKGEIRSGSLADLVPGREQVRLYRSEGRVVAAVLDRLYQCENIRVVLRADLNRFEPETLMHPLLRISSTDTLILEDRVIGEKHFLTPGAILLLEPVAEGIKATLPGKAPLLFKNRLFITPQSGGRIAIHNLSRDGWGEAAPQYRGTLEVVEQDGRLILVNEVPLEQYLYTVVPSEMPVSFGAEPLKVQAVAARTYAYALILQNGYSAYGAHVDDSVQTQVYNNNPEHPDANAAVDSTAGQVLFYNEEVAGTYFFSTSCGYTANCDEVWQHFESGDFPGKPVPYLRARSQVPGFDFSLEQEEQVREFLLRKDWPAYDRESPYFRWRVEMTREELEASINNNLASRQSSQPEYVLTKADGQFISREIPPEPLGELLQIRVVRRGAGGNIMELELEGTGGTYRLLKEYNIRFTLRPAQYLPGRKPVILECSDGSHLENYSILPSAFVVFETVKDSSGRIQRIIITGGGNGHGVGMSQHGAKGMAALGKSYRDILEHYYPGTTIRNIMN